MPRISDTAHVTLDGVRVDHTSPLEDQSQVVYQAARRFAEANGFKPHVHQGPYGPKKGLSGPMVMKRLISQLFPGFNADEFATAYGLISQVLRKTDAAVCIGHPPQRGDGQADEISGSTPIWFIADTMPANIVVVAIHIRKKSAGLTPPSSFDEKAFMTNREKFRVTPEEAGETLPPGEVVTRRTGKIENLGEIYEQRREAHRRFKDRVLEELKTAPVPLTARELYVVINAEGEWTYDTTTYQNTITELFVEGLAVRRKETPAERRVRGAGAMPKGGAAYLYWPAPGPVPERDRLPKGVAPAKGAQVWYDESVQRVTEDAETILEYVKTHVADERRRNPLLAALGIGEERLDAALQRLIRDGLIVTRNHRYYLSEARTVNRRRKSEAETEPTPTNTPESGFTQDDVPGKLDITTPTAVPDPDSLQLLLDLARKLGVTLPQGPDPETERLRIKNRQLTETVNDQSALISKLEKQVHALKAAIASLE